MLNRKTVENSLQTIFNRTQTLIIYPTESTEASSTKVFNIFQQKCIKIPICLN